MDRSFKYHRPRRQLQFCRVTTPTRSLLMDSCTNLRGDRIRLRREWTCKAVNIFGSLHRTG